MPKLWVLIKDGSKSYKKEQKVNRETSLFIQANKKKLLTNTKGSVLLSLARNDKVSVI